MKKYLLSILFFACCLIVYAQDVSTAKWMPQPVVVDGNASEWRQPLNFYDSETKLLFAISNDSANIYLCFEAKDEATQRKIMRAGMKVSLEMKGRDRKTASIAYPLVPKDRNQTNEPDDTQTTKTEGDASTNTDAADGTYHKPDPTVFRARFLTNNILMNLDGFTTTNGMIPVRGKAISVAMNWDAADNLFYEIAIPIKEFLDDGYTAEDIAKEITLHVEVNAMQPGGGEHRGGNDGGGFSEAGGGGMQGGGMRGGGMRGGGGGGGMRGGGMRGGGGGMDRSGMETKTSFKQKFVLGTSAQQ